MSHETIRLRDYQREAVDALKGQNKVVLNAAVGAGKSVIQAFLALDELVNRRAHSVLLVTHSNILCEQNMQKVRAVFGQAGQTKLADRVRAVNIMTLGRRELSDYVREATLVIVDEAHRVGSEGFYNKLIEHIDCVGARVIGMTGSPSRLGFGAIYGDKPYNTTPPVARPFTRCAYTISIKTLQQKGFLSPVTVHKWAAGGVEMKGHSGQSDYTTNEAEMPISKWLATSSNVKEMLNIMKHSETKVGIAFVPSVRLARILERDYSALGGRCEVVSADTPEADRLAIKKRIEQEGGLFITVNTLTTGFDCPSISVIFALRPTVSKTLITQMVGRGLRLHAGKTHLYIYNVCGWPGDLCEQGDEEEAVLKDEQFMYDKTTNDRECPFCGGQLKRRRVCGRQVLQEGGAGELTTSDDDEERLTFLSDAKGWLQKARQSLCSDVAIQQSIKRALFAQGRCGYNYLAKSRIKQTVPTSQFGIASRPLKVTKEGRNWRATVSRWCELLFTYNGHVATVSPTCPSAPARWFKGEAELFQFLAQHNEETLNKFNGADRQDVILHFLQFSRFDTYQAFRATFPRLFERQAKK